MAAASDGVARRVSIGRVSVSLQFAFFILHFSFLIETDARGRGEGNAK